MFSLRPAPLGLLLAVLAASSAAAGNFTRVTWTTGGSKISKTRTRLVVEASGQARLERDHGPAGLTVGSPQPVLQGRLAPGELRALEAAFGASEWDQLPRQLAAGFNGARLDLQLERAGRPTLRVEGFTGHYGDRQALLEPVQQVLDAVRARLQASSTELSLEIDRMPLPSTLRADEDLEIVVSGPGLPGVEFTSLRASLSGRSLRVEALGRQVALAPAQRFSERLRVERAGRVGLGYLHVSRTGDTFGAQVLIVQDEAATSGRFTGKVVKRKGQVGLEVEVARGEKRFRPLDAAASAQLERFPGEYVQFDGRVDGAGRLGIQRLIRPERRTVEGIMQTYGSIRAEGLGHVSTFGPVHKVLQGIERGTRVEVEGWFFSEGGWPGPRRWYETGMRSIYRAQRLYAERVRAQVSEEVKLKRGWRTRATLAPGREVWIRGRRFFGWSAEVETADGAESGRARLKKRFDFARPAKLATEGGGVGISGALGGAGSP